MAIETYAGSGNFTTRVPVNSNGYMYTVGPANGSKLYHPGTRGIVYQDVSMSTPYTNYPTFRLYQSTGSIPWRVNSLGYGYYGVMYDNPTWRSQYTGYDLLGMRDIIINNEATIDPYGTLYIFPKEKTLGGTYQLDNIIRYGNKPVTTTPELSNTDIFRHLRMSATINKWEAHVYVTYRNSSQVVVNYAWDSITNAYINVYNNGQFTAFTLSRKAVTPAATNAVGGEYFYGDFTRNLPTESFFFFPVFRFIPSGDDNILKNTDFYVQTKFCFKTD